MTGLNFDDERIMSTPVILYIDYISIQYKKYLMDNYDDITPRDFTYLVNIFYHQNISQRELADFLFVSEANVAQIIKRLEKNELIYRVSDENNKNRKTIHLTEKGKNILFKLLDEIFKWENDFFEQYGDEDKAKFKKIIYDYSEKSISP